MRRVPNAPLRAARAVTDAISGRPMAVAASVSLAVAWPTVAQPVWALATLLVLAAMVALGDRTDHALRRATSAVGLIGCAALALAPRWDEPATGLVLGVAGSLALVHLRAGAGRVGAATTLALAVAALVIPDELGLSRIAALTCWSTAAAVVAVAHPRTASGDVLDVLLDSPARLMVVSFAALCFGGAVLLVLPASAGAAPIRFIDALFTAVSATCVTGLAVLDTPKAFSFFGQAVILGLIQMGGLGIMAFATAAAVYLGRRMGMRHEAVAAELMGGGAARKDLEAALVTVFGVTFATEGVGAALLAVLYALGGEPLPAAIWKGVFTSISAFCNAGFALNSDSLMSYRDRPAILAVIGAIIVIGGLGPPIIAAAGPLRRGRGSLQARLVLVSTALLLVVPAALILALEWQGTLADLSLVDKLSNAWFQSITLRTAGFNSIDFAAITPATWTVSVLAMFIGGSPSSTAGGIKTTTMAVLVLALWSTIRGNGEASAFGRRIPHRTVYEATAISTVAVLSAIGALMALQLTQDLPLDQALFEVVSALATVGLSMGATARLDDVGKIIIMACMFAGRVGPLTLFIFLMGRARSARRYPLESLQVG